MQCDLGNQRIDFPLAHFHKRFFVRERIPKLIVRPIAGVTLGRCPIKEPANEPGGQKGGQKQQGSVNQRSRDFQQNPAKNERE